MLGTDELVDRFVAVVNGGYREPVSAVIYDVPMSVLVGESDYHSWDWAIKPYADIDWIEPIEARLGHQLPDSYRSLMMRYIFPHFDAGEITFFANTPEGTESREFRIRLFTDFPELQSAGYLQFGQPAELSYDPVCFDLNRGGNDDYPIVRLDHEEIICRDTIAVIAKIAPSFRDFIFSVIADAGEHTAR